MPTELPDNCAKVDKRLPPSKIFSFRRVIIRFEGCAEFAATIVQQCSLIAMFIEYVPIVGARAVHVQEEQEDVRLSLIHI